jgi:hypothetical protein
MKDSRLLTRHRSVSSILAALALTSAIGCGSSGQDGLTGSDSGASSPPATSPATSAATTTGVTDDQMAVSMMAKAMGRVGIGCEGEISYQEDPIEPFWSVGGESVPIVMCLDSSKGYGAEFSYSADGQAPIAPSGVSNGSGGYLLIGSNFVIEFGGEDPGEACTIKSALPVKAKVIATGSPKANC